MVNEAFYILKYENFRFTFFDYSCKLTEKSPSGIFKAFSFSYHRECLTWGTPDKNIYFIFEGFCIEVMYIGVPTAIINGVVGKIRFFAIVINITGKNNLSV